MRHEYYLNAIYDGRKSFYGKARVVEDDTDGSKTLISYTTEICTITGDKNKLIRHWYGSSRTTTRHIKEFLKQEGIPYSVYTDRI